MKNALIVEEQFHYPNQKPQEQLHLPLLTSLPLPLPPRTATETDIRGHLTYLGFTFKKRKPTDFYVTELVEMVF
jgi:hypothetical protein